MSGAGPVALAAWALCASMGGALGAEPSQGRLVEDPDTQAAIEATVSAIVRNDDEAAADRFAALQTIGGPDRGGLLLQVALYLEGADGSDLTMAGAIVLTRLGFTPKETIDAVVPRLDGAGRGLRRVFTGMLATVDRRDGGEADFSVYDAWLAARPDRPQAAFVAYLYEASPDEAVLLMQRIYGRPATLPPRSSRAIDELKRIASGRDASRSLTEEERSRGAAALTTLADDPAWWVRRYAAMALRDDAALGSSATVERLKRDPDPLVRDGFVRPPAARGND